MHLYLLKKELHEHKIDRKVVNLEEAKDIGILFDATNTDNSKVINTFADALREQKKRPHLLGFYNFPKGAINFNFPYFNKKDLNWYSKPGGDVVNNFIERKFDILINAYMDEILPLEYISALSHANYRVGHYDKKKTYCYDLMIDMRGNDDLKSLMQQIKHYLHIL